MRPKRSRPAKRDINFDWRQGRGREGDAGDGDGDDDDDDGDSDGKAEVEEVYCLCQEPANGEDLLGCDGKTCQHLVPPKLRGCDNISALPKTWFCPACKDAC